ncbi:MAG: TonB family protein [Thiogranum sp.]
MFARYSIAGLTGLMAAALLLWLMQFLVTPPQGKRTATESAGLVDFIRLKREERLQLKERQLPEPPSKPQQLPRPKLNLDADIPQPASLQPDMAFGLNLPVTLGEGPYLGPVATQLDRAFIPLSRQPPRYPWQAARRGTEGWVRVSFRVTETGTVEDVVMLESKPPGVFDKAAIQAVYRWRFKPRIVNGKAVAGRAEQVVDFRLKQ